MSTLMPYSLPTPHMGIRPTWLWPGRIPCGKITLLAGDPGLGKSFIALDLAARLSTGSPMPPIPSPTENEKCGRAKIENSFSPLPPAATLLFSAEDELHDTILPRLAASGADPARIHPIRCLDSHQERPEPFSLKTHLDEIPCAIEQHNAQLLIFDPITAFMDGIDLNSTSHIRQYLTPLAHLAAFYNTAILAITHLNKEHHRQSLYRAAGSLALAAIARSVLLVHPAPTRTHNLVSSLKANLSSPPPPIPFRLNDNRIEWLDAEAVAAEELPALTSEFFERHDLELAVDYLRECLADGPKPAVPLIRRARALAISERTLRRAKARLGVISQNKGHQGEWFWRFAEQAL